MMECVTKATPIQFIDSRCHIKEWKGHKTALSGYYVWLLRDLLLMPLGWTHMPILQTKRFQETRCTWATCACFFACVLLECSHMCNNSLIVSPILLYLAGPLTTMMSLDTLVVTIVNFTRNK